MRSSAGSRRPAPARAGSRWLALARNGVWVEYGLVMGLVWVGYGLFMGWRMGVVWVLYGCCVVVVWVSMGYGWAALR